MLMKCPEFSREDLLNCTWASQDSQASCISAVLGIIQVTPVVQRYCRTACGDAEWMLQYQKSSQNGQYTRHAINLW